MIPWCLPAPSEAGFTVSSLSAMVLRYDFHVSKLSIFFSYLLCPVTMPKTFVPTSQNSNSFWRANCFVKILKKLLGMGLGVLEDQQKPRQQEIRLNRRRVGLCFQGWITKKGAEKERRQEVKGW